IAVIVLASGLDPPARVALDQVGEQVLDEEIETNDGHPDDQQPPKNDPKDYHLATCPNAWISCRAGWIDVKPRTARKPAASTASARSAQSFWLPPPSPLTRGPACPGSPVGMLTSARSPWPRRPAAYSSRACA